MSIAHLEKNVRNAQAALYALRGKKFDSDAFTSAHDAVLAAEAELAKERSEPYAIPLDLGVETGREAPVMLSSPPPPPPWFARFSGGSRRANRVSVVTL